jgi:hypothetical protein
LADNQVRGPVSKALIDEFSREYLAIRVGRRINYFISDVSEMHLHAQIHDIASML